MNINNSDLPPKTLSPIVLEVAREGHIDLETLTKFSKNPIDNFLGFSHPFCYDLCGLKKNVL